MKKWPKRGTYPSPTDFHFYWSTRDPSIWTADNGWGKGKKRKKKEKEKKEHPRSRSSSTFLRGCILHRVSLSLSLSLCPPPSRALSFPLPRAPLPFFFGTCSQPPAEKSAPWPFDGCVKTRAQLFASSISHGVKEEGEGGGGKSKGRRDGARSRFPGDIRPHCCSSRWYFIGFMTSLIWSRAPPTPA